MHKTTSVLYCEDLLSHNIENFFWFQSMIGHGLGAAGGLEAIATIKAITTGWVHPTINQDVLHLNFHFPILNAPFTQFFISTYLIY